MTEIDEFVKIFVPNGEEGRKENLNLKKRQPCSLSLKNVAKWYTVHSVCCFRVVVYYGVVWIVE